MVRKGEITNRTDAEYYDLIFNMAAKSVFPLYSVGSQFIIKDGDHNKFPSEHDSDKSNGIRYLRSQDLKDGEIIDLKPIFVSKEYFNKIKRSEIKSGYILFSIMASVGSVVIYPENREDCTANRAVGILVPKQNNIILPQYFRVLFNTFLGETLIQTLKKGGVQQRINLFDFSQLKIPIPPLETQKKIAAFFENSYCLTKQKEAEAATLLASIDSYLLQALGITLLSPGEKKTFFYTRASKVSGGRLDPFYHQCEFESIDLALQNANSEVHTLGYLTVDLKNGAEFRTYSDEGYRYLRVTDLSKHGLTNEKMRFVNVPEIPERLKLNHNCILISRSGSLGLVNVVTDEIIDSILSSHIFKVQLNTKLVLPTYLESYLRSVIGQKQIFRNNNGGVIPELNQSALKSIKILLPPLEKQTEIADHIGMLRSQAKQLQQQAKAELEQAKQQVECMILGVH